MNKHLVLLFLLGLFITLNAAAQSVLDFEIGYVIPGYNDVAIPGDSGTRFSLTDDLSADETVAVRLRYGYTFSDKHWVAFLAAPLTVESRGTLENDILFQGATFPEGSDVKASYRFDSYRLIYRYHLYRSERLRFSFGVAAKIRDAEIKLESDDVSARKTDTGFVPLLSFNLTWTPVERFHLVLDGDALAASQGRAEDVLLAAQYDVNQTLSLRAGYRILEGGADNDEVYTFSLFHYIVAGLQLIF